MKYFLAIAFATTLLGQKYVPASRLSLANKQTTTAQWDSTKNWKLYKLSNFNRVFHISADSLPYLRSKPLNDDSVHAFLANSQKITGINPMWQGCYLASYQTSDGMVRKAVISHYGGFFYCQPDNAYFQISPKDQQDWLEYLSNSYVSIPR